jgi:CHAT domain-containing protein
MSAKAIQRAKLNPDSAEFAGLDHEIEDLVAAHEEIEAEIRAASPAYAALTHPRPLSLTEIQALLDPGTLLLEYALGAEHSSVWAVTPSGLHTYELPPRVVIEAAARDFRRTLPDIANPRSFEDASAKLGAMLLDPVAAELGTKRLVVVSDAALQAAVPFAALASLDAPLGRPHPLVVDHEIVQETSASVVAALRLGIAGPTPAPGLVAVLADPVVSAGDGRLTAPGKAPTAVAPNLMPEAVRAVTPNGVLERLPNTRVEANDILKLVPPSRSFAKFGFDATKQAAEDPGLARYRIVLFATHGLLDPREPALSGLVFSLFAPDGTPRDGYLRLNDVFNLTLPVDLVVLSACESGQGKVVGGEGLVGITRGFLYAGAERLVVSLWEVNDRAAARLMAKFYRAVLASDHVRPAAALRRAQIAMIREGKWRHPWYWAPFIIQGEWR